MSEKKTLGRLPRDAIRMLDIPRPPKEVIDEIHASGRLVAALCGSARQALRHKQAGVDIIVACPGRLEDLLEQDALDLRSVTTVVVDEAAPALGHALLDVAGDAQALGVGDAGGVHGGSLSVVGRC